MPNKRYGVSAKFPEIAAAHAFQYITVEAPNYRRAAKLGIDALAKRQAIKGKRIKTVVLTITEEGKAEE